MVYPTLQPKAKHALAAVKKPPPYPESLLQAIGFSNSTELFQAVDAQPHPPPHKIADLYSYPDAPDYPGPLASSLGVLGVADESLRSIRTLVGGGTLPDCMHKCTVAVQLADAKHMDRLEKRHKENSTSFAKFIQQLRKDQAVAILAKDKYNRFGILVPIMSNETIGENSHGRITIMPEDCVAHVYVGDTKEVLNYLANQATQAPSNTISAMGDSNALWQPPQGATSSEGTSYSNSNNNNNDNATMEGGDMDTGSWKPPGANDDFAATTASTFSAPWETSNGATYDSSTNSAWDMGGGSTTDFTFSGNKRSYADMNYGGGDDHAEDDNGNGENTFHADSGAAAADAFYSGLTRSLDTRADSYLYHMRAFNGWVKATQIQELDPVILGPSGRPQTKQPLRVLDLACGKGGDLTKWTLHTRGMKHYVGIDVARGSLRDAAIRAREMRKRNKLKHAVFTVADLGADVPGRKKSPNSKHMQKLLTWSLTDEAEYESATPEFTMKRGGGVKETDRFDVVSIQFAIHYMMSTRQRARRFFHTVSELLEVGGNLICTTIDARVIIENLMNLGLNFHFKDGEPAEFTEAVVQAGAGACKIKFEPEIVKRLVTSLSDGQHAEEDLFGLQYTFTLVEGSDHAAGVGDAVNLPEWLTPLPVLQALARDAGLELDYAQNFHEFYEARKDPSKTPAAHLALYNMKVLNRDGTISAEEWSVSRLYAAIKFRKVRESSITFDDENETEGQDESDDDDNEPALDPVKAAKLYPMAMINAKRAIGEDAWNAMSGEEKKRHTQVQLKILARK